ncbi:6-phosphogluconate dehydrogenase [Cucumis melo var. makuwa]|uniref:6-phosphogluconate dehydrogenase n=1 Tax=Cucumis melo var. makuwa TaxID=1194695 RepID=A0A5A7UFK0_CUCMM|nr:6-phosphogluconate dehydrogenase [Cucumis melo var. makuwa]
MCRLTCWTSTGCHTTNLHLTSVSKPRLLPKVEPQCRIPLVLRSVLDEARSTPLELLWVCFGKSHIKYRRARLPANLVEAQRDLFEAHTYERVDRLDSYHTGWTKLARNANTGVGIFN